MFRTTPNQTPPEIIRKTNETQRPPTPILIPPKQYQKTCVHAKVCTHVHMYTHSEQLGRVHMQRDVRLCVHGETATRAHNPRQ